MSKKILILIKGILLGFVSLAIPGLSASTIGLIVNIYYDMIDAISNIFKNPKKSIPFLTFLIVGFLLGNLIGAFTVDTAYAAYPLAVTITIWGFILGGIPGMIKDLLSHFKKVSNLIILVVIITLLVLNTYLFKEASEVLLENMELYDYILLVVVGFITAATLVIPGIDFAVVLLSMGYYYALVGVVANIFDMTQLAHNLAILVPYAIGYLIGTFLFSKVIKIICNKYEIQTKFAGLAFVLAAPAIVVKNCIVDNPDFKFSVLQLIVGIVLAIIGFGILFYTTYIYPKKKKNNNANETV